MRVRTAVFAVPDERAGQLPVAVVEAAPGMHATDLAGFLDGELGPDDRPTAILVVPTLPRGVTGKILKRQLRETYQDFFRITHVGAHGT